MGLRLSISPITCAESSAANCMRNLTTWLGCTPAALAVSYRACKPLCRKELITFVALHVAHHVSPHTPQIAGPY